MRARVFGLMIGMAVAISGGSHVAHERSADWSANVAPSSIGTKDNTPKSGTVWSAKVTTDDYVGGNWYDLLITPASNKGPHAVAHRDGPYLLDSGDQLRIFVYGQPNLSRIYKVDRAGKIMVPLIGLVRAQRRTTYQLAGVIRARLATQYVRDPQVTVDMHQNRPFFILGEVRNPGQYPYVNGMTVETAVAIAGGYSPRANQHRVHISRRVDGTVELAKGGVDYVVRPGDTIKVAERFF